MTGHATIEQSRWLKAHGFEQDMGDGIYYVQAVHDTQQPKPWFPYLLIGPPSSNVPWLAAPVLLSGDPEHPGVVEWFESQEWTILRSSPNDRLVWWADHPVLVKPSALFPHGNYPEASTLPALIDKIMKEMEK